jgi:Xaa-Pro aminopeptidase
MPRKKTKAKKPPIPRVIAERLARTRRRMADANLPAYLVTNPPDQYYLTGFTGEDGAALITPRQVYLLTDGRFTEQARVEAGWANARIRIKGLSDELTKLARRLGFDRLGIQPNHLTLRMADTIRKAIRPARLVKAKPIADNLRLRKDPAEIQAIRRAARVAQDAFHATRRAIRIGMTEREIAARLEYEMQRRGAAGPAFPTIVAEGPSAALPHYRPAARRIRPGSLILIDWGATVDHYRSDLTRVLFVRTISPRFRRIYRAVAEAQRRAIQAVRPGASTRDVDGAARRYLRSAGLG